MQDNMDWTKKYYTEEAQGKIEERKQLWSLQNQERWSKEWSDLFRDVEAALGEIPPAKKLRLWPRAGRNWWKASQVVIRKSPRASVRCMRIVPIGRATCSNACSRSARSSGSSSRKPSRPGMPEAISGDHASGNGYIPFPFPARTGNESPEFSTKLPQFFQCISALQTGDVSGRYNARYESGNAASRARIRHVCTRISALQRDFTGHCV